MQNSRTIAMNTGWLSLWMRMALLFLVFRPFTLHADIFLLPNGSFDSSSTGWYWENWSAAGSEAGFDAANNSSGGGVGSGSLKLRCQFVSQSDWQGAAFSFPLPGRFDAGALYHEISCDVRVDQISTPRTTGDYGFIQVVLRNGDGWIWADLPPQRLSSTGWTRFAWRLSDAKTNINTITAVTLLVSDSDLRGPVTVNVDNLAFETKVKGNQTIAFPALARRKFGDAPFTLAATASSGLPIFYSIVSGPALLNGSTLTLTGVGVVTVRASQPGNAEFNAAPPMEESFVVDAPSVTPQPLEGASYPRVEASFNLGGLSSDPAVLFDYAQTDVKVIITRPDASTIQVPAFYDGGTTWRVRHTPIGPGNHLIERITVNGAAAVVSNLSATNWMVVGFPSSAGYVRVDPSNSRRFATSDGWRFFPVGHNVAWSSPAANIVNIFPKMGAAHENWSRVWMTAFYEGAGLGLNLDWPKVSGAFGRLSLANARNWDAIVSAAEQAGIHFQMVFQHHGQYSTNVDPNWKDNPYNSANGGFLPSAASFFTNAMAKALTKRKLRYAIARWGYSPSVMAWELFNEVQFTDAAQSGQMASVAAWHDEMAAFLRAQDPYGHLITTSSDNFSQPIWNSMDYYQVHNYAPDTINSTRNPPNPGAAAPVKPVFMGESTPHDSSSPARLWVHAPLWASLMAADAGAACPWWWDTIDPEQDYSFFRAVSDFVSISALADQNSLVRLEPPVTGGGGGSLVFAPGGGWANAGQDTFTVAGAAPEGIATAPSFLQGDYHRGMTPNGFTFSVNYPQAGTFSVRLRTIALSGAGLQILVDNVVKTNISFPSSLQDISTDFVAVVSVPSGSHMIKIWNPGKDWVDLAAITLDPYVPAIGAYAIANGAFNATWIWHRTNIFNIQANQMVAGAVDIIGLEPGTYFGTWWDTFQGQAISNVTFTLSDSSGAITVGTPPFVRSLAFFASRTTNGPAGNAAPAITLQPQSQTVSHGQSVTFIVAGNGTPPIVYQWQKDNVPLAGQTQPSFTMNNLTAASVGNYTVVVGNSFGAVTSAVAVLSLARSTQSITFEVPQNRIYGDPPFNLAALASSGLPVSFTVTSGPASIGGDTLRILAAGNVTVNATQAGNADFDPATPVERAFSVAKRELLVKTDDVTRAYGKPNPPLTAVITGYVNGDSPSVVTGEPALRAGGDDSSPAGIYPITVEVGTLEAANYTFTFLAGLLTVTKADQTIFFPQISDKRIGDPPFSVSATASSGLPVSFAVSGPATVLGNMLTVTNIGLVTVSASQSGDENYNTAVVERQTFAVLAAPEIRISNVRLENGMITFRWSALPGATYDIQVRTNLSDAGWTIFDRVSATTETGGYTNEVILTDTRFYRVQSSP